MIGLTNLTRSIVPLMQPIPAGSNRPYRCAGTSLDSLLTIRFPHSQSPSIFHLSAHFTELPPNTFAVDHIAQIVMIVTTGKQPVGVDVRWIDLV